MSNNHFFIGLGSTGGNIIREIRKQVDVRSSFFSKMEEDYGLALDYLYINSHGLELQAKWEGVLGHDVSLPVNKRKDIRQVDINELLNNANNMPAIQPWLGSKKFINNIVGQVAGTPGANQRRRFGRLLFANAAGTIMDHIKSAVQELQQNQKQVGVNFHLLGTLGGGTGSGSIVDMALMLRSTYNELDYPINAYVLVTDSPCPKDVGYFYQNQYSALCDLNRLLASHNVHFELLTDPLGQKYKAGQALQHCYIVTDKSESGRVASKEEQEKTLADWLLQTISMLARNDDPELVDMFKSFTGEDLLSVHPGESDNGATGLERSYAFSSLGILHWASPEEKIKEQVANELAHSLLLGIRYSNYKFGVGYLSAALPANRQNYLTRHPHKTMGCELSDICEENKVTGSKGFEKYYRSACKNIAGGARAAKQAEKTVQAVGKLLDSEWDAGFAGCGVDNFYKAMSRPNEMDKNAETQIQRFLEPLQEAFVSGKLGIVDAKDVINEACEMVDDVLDKITADESELRSVSFAKKECNRLERVCEIARGKFCKAGFFASLFGTKKKLMKSYIVKASDYYAARTRLCAYDYAAKYLQRLKFKFDSLLKNVEAVCGELDKAIDDLAVEIGNQHQMLTALSQVGSNRYVFDQQRVKDFVGNAKQDGGLLESTCKKMINSLFDFYCASNQNGTKWFYTAFDHLDLVKQCRGWGGSVLVEFEQSSKQTLCPGILEALYNQIGNNPGSCKKQCEDFMKQADVLLRIESAAPQPGMVTKSSMPTMPKKSVLIEIPTAKNKNLIEFTNLLKEHLKNAVSDVPPGNVHIIDTNGNESEIAVTVCVSYMAARFVACLSTLKKKYDTSLDGKIAEQVRYFCHLDDDYAQRENLFLPSGK